MSKPVIAGIGETPITPPSSGRAAERMTLDAVAKACRDAGMDPSQLDGVVKYNYDGSLSAMALASNFGFKDLSVAAEIPHGGGSSGALVDVASMAVESGRAGAVVCFRTVVAEDWLKQLVSGDPLRPYYLDAVNYLRPLGWAGYLHLFAALYEEYRALYGLERDTLWATLNLVRRNAAANPGALRNEPVSREEYFEAPMTVGPFSQFDEFTPADLSCAVIVTAEGVSGQPDREVQVLASAQSQGPDPKAWFDLRPFSSTYPDGPSAWVASELYERSGLTPEDIDVALLYDCTTFTMLDLIEQYRLCEPGGVARLIEEEGILASGSVPVNPHGGDLAGGYSHGFRHVLEAVRQVRGEAENQVPGARTALVAAPQVGPTSGLILSSVNKE